MMGWQWDQLDHMQVICTSLQTDNHASTSSLSFIQVGRPSCCPIDSVKTLKDALKLNKNAQHVKRHNSYRLTCRAWSRMRQHAVCVVESPPVPLSEPPLTLVSLPPQPPSTHAAVIPPQPSIPSNSHTTSKLDTGLKVKFIAQGSV